MKARLALILALGLCVGSVFASDEKPITEVRCADVVPDDSMAARAKALGEEVLALRTMALEAKDYAANDKARIAVGNAVAKLNALVTEDRPFFGNIYDGRYGTLLKSIDRIVEDIEAQITANDGMLRGKPQAVMPVAASQ